MKLFEELAKLKEAFVVKTCPSCKMLCNEHHVCSKCGKICCELCYSEEDKDCMFCGLGSKMGLC